MSDYDALRTQVDAALLSTDPYTALDELQRAGVFRDALPEVEAIVGFGGGKSGHKDLWDHTRRVVAQCPMTLRVRLAALFHDVGKPVAFKMRAGKVTFHGHELDSLWQFKRARDRTGAFEDVGDGVEGLLVYLGRTESYEPGWEDSAVRRLSRDVGPLWDELIALTKADCTTGRPEKRARVQGLACELDERRKRLVEADAVLPALPKGLGDALMARYGKPGGKWLGDVMAQLKTRVEAGELPRHGDVSDYLTDADTLVVP